LIQGPADITQRFFLLCDDIKHLKNRQFWWLEMA
jgi:hypothetical protein